MTQAQTLQRKLQKGGLIDAASVERTDLIERAQSLGLAAYVVDCDRARSRSAVLRAVVKAVDFPEYFGGNLDALYDCLCDTVLDQPVGMVLALRRLHRDDPGLAEHVPAIAQVGEDMVEFARENGRAFTFILDCADGAAASVQTGGA